MTGRSRKARGPRLREHISGATLGVFADGGHLTSLTCPAVLSTLIRYCLSEAGRPRVERA